MTRLVARTPAPVKWPWWDGWLPAAFIGLLVGCLIYTSGVAKQAQAEVRRLQAEVALQPQWYDDGVRDRERLLAEIDRLVAITPTERIVVQPCAPKPRERQRALPAFSRDSQFVGVNR